MLFGINNFKRVALSHSSNLVNLEGKMVNLKAGEHFNAVAVTNGVHEYFGLENKEKGMVIFPTSLFANNFKLFQKEI